MLHPLQALLPP